MISILVPIYNVDITELVTELSKQAKNLKERFEILSIDDCSTSTSIKATNALLSSLELVNYSELKKNVGRGNIRMLLAKKAKYETLIFLDCDMKIVNPNYLEKFVQHIDKKVVIGGITYSTPPPKNPNFLYNFIKISKETINIIRPRVSFSIFILFFKTTKNTTDTNITLVISFHILIKLEEYFITPNCNSFKIKWVFN